MDTLTVLATNDFLASVDPSMTTFGRLPGAHALKCIVDRERNAGPCLWVDAGDFAQGGPLATRTGGHGGFKAFADLGPDVAVVGNHEFDWGTDHLLAHAEAATFPFLCANRAIGLPAWHVLELGSATVAVVGATHPHLEDFVTRPPNVETLPIVQALESALADAPATDWTILVVHDGFSFGPTVDATDAPAWLGELSSPRRIDLVVGGHTLTRFVGRVGDMPFLQPWSHGLEIGVCRLRRDRADLETLRPEPPESDPAASEEDIVGINPRSRFNAPGRDRSLQDFLAECLRDGAQADVALVPGSSLVMQQPPVDGILGFLPAGEISQAFIERLIPWLDDGAVIATMDPSHVEALLRAADSDYGTCGFAPTTKSNGPSAVAMPQHLLKLAETVAEGRLETQPAQPRLRTLVAEALAQ